MAEGVGANALGDPLNVLEWTANHLSALGDGIKAGEVVSTGTCTGVTPIAAGETLIADFGTLGRVEVRSSKSREDDESSVRWMGRLEAEKWKDYKRMDDKALFLGLPCL